MAPPKKYNRIPLLQKQQIPEEPQKPKREKWRTKREAFVFLDDNPMEVESVRQHLPEVKWGGGTDVRT